MNHRIPENNSVPAPAIGFARGLWLSVKGTTRGFFATTGLVRAAVSCVFFLACQAWASGAALGGSPSDTLSATSQLSLLTILPGDQVYSMFGHSALRVYDPELELDRVYNYGTFEFGNPVIFVGRFAYGKLDYLLSVAPYARMMRQYHHVERRPVIEQVLNLSDDQKRDVFQFLEWNSLPENRSYRYDFIFDNCSTRIRDVLFEHVPDLQLTLEPVGDITFRRMLDPYGIHRPFMDFGWDLLMGAPLDRVAQPWETTFLPLELMAVADSAVIRTSVSEFRLVASRDTIFWIDGAGMPQPTLPWPSIVGWLIFGIGFGVTALERSRAFYHGRWFDVVLFGITGLVGIAVTFMWFFTLHNVTLYNWNVLWAWPVHLVAAMYLARSPGARWLRSYLATYAVLSSVVLLGWVLLPQELPIAAIPIVLVLLLRSAWRASVREQAGAATERAPVTAS